MNDEHDNAITDKEMSERINKSKADKFMDWVESEGAEIEVTQENDGSGYTVMELKLPHLWGGITFDVTVNE